MQIVYFISIIAYIIKYTKTVYTFVLIYNYCHVIYVQWNIKCIFWSYLKQRSCITLNQDVLMERNTGKNFKRPSIVVILDCTRCTLCPWWNTANSKLIRIWNLDSNSGFSTLARLRYRLFDLGDKGILTSRLGARVVSSAAGLYFDQQTLQWMISYCPLLVLHISWHSAHAEYHTMLHCYPVNFWHMKIWWM